MFLIGDLDSVRATVDFVRRARRTLLVMGETECDE
jgi:hypothetical protein